jgi:hypothetical protein
VKTCFAAEVHSSDQVLDTNSSLTPSRKSANLDSLDIKFFVS